METYHYDDNIVFGILKIVSLKDLLMLSFAQRYGCFYARRKMFKKVQTAQKRNLFFIFQVGSNS